jgi:hypothetical protein
VVFGSVVNILHSRYAIVSLLLVLLALTFNMASGAVFLSLHSSRKFAILMTIALLWDCRAAGAMPKFEGCSKHSNKKGSSLSASCRWT